MTGGHVDDFHRIGDPRSNEWATICARTDAAYKWGTAKVDEYRHAGTDLKVSRDRDGNQTITVNQQYYIDMLQDVDIAPDRLRDEHASLTTSDMASCRGALGNLQWIAVQTQHLLCGRCDILLSELIKHGKMSYALEIQRIICEVRHQPSDLKYAKNWTDIVVITLSDQAHNNRPGGDSTRGLDTLMVGPEAKGGHVCPMVFLSWQSWKLKRKAISSNDAEVQAALEGEDHNFRIRLLWTEMHGAGWNRTSAIDQVAWAEQQVRNTIGILGTDSRGGYDTVQVNDSPMLGLSNLRAALQVLQLRESLIRTSCHLRWLACKRL